MKIGRRSSSLKPAQSRGMSAMLRRLAARRATRALASGALLAFGGHAALAQGAVNGDTQYNFQNSAGNFSTGFGPMSFMLGGDSNGQLNFGGTTYTATDDLGSASVNNLTFTSSGLVTIAPSATTNTLTLTANSLGVLPSIYVGSGGATITTVLQGSAGFVKNGTGVLTLATNADTFTGTAQVNAGTLVVNIGQNANAAFAINNGATLTSNQAFAATNVITALSGTSTFTDTSGTFVGTIAGNGNLNLSLAGNSNPNTGLLTQFGGTVTFTDAPGLRIIQGTGGGTFNAAFATVDFAANTVSFTSRNAAQIILGGLASTSTTANVGSTSNGGAVGIIVGSANGNTTFNGVVATNSGGTSLTKVGVGTLTLTGLNTYSGATNVNGGTLLLNYATNASNVLTATSALNLGGGTLSLLGKNSGATTQTLGNVTATGAGAGNVILNTNGGTSTTLTLGTLTATAAGSALNFNTASGGTVTTTSNKDATGIYGGRITYTDATGTNWATTTSGATPFTLSGYTGYTALNAAGGATDTNNSLQTDGATLGGSVTTNSLKVTDTAAGNTLDLGGAANTLTLTNGGLLFTGANAYTITDGTLASGTSATTPDLIVNQFGTGTLTIGAVISNGAGTGAGTLTKAGPGTLILTGANTYTGATFLTGGTTSIGANVNLGAEATGAALILNGGTLQATGTFGLFNGAAGANNRAVNIGGGGGAFDVTGANNLTVAGVVTNLAANQFGPLIKTGTGTLTLSGTNTYSGATIIRGGILSTGLLANGGTASGIGNSNNTAPALVLDGGTLQYTGGTVSSDRTFTLTNNGGTLDSAGSGALTLSNSNPGAYTGTGARTLTLTNSGGTNTAANVLATQIINGTGGATGVTKTGTGTWTLTNANNTYTGATTVGAGTLALANVNSANSLANSGTISVGQTAGSNAVLDVTGLSGGGITLGNQTLAGTGTVNGGVTAGAGAAISPGTGSVGTGTVGTLGVGSLTLNSGATLNYDFGASVNDLINDAGLLTLSASAPAGSIGFNLFQAGSTNKFTTAGTYNLIAAPSETGPTSDLAVLNPATGLTYSFAYNTGFLQLTIAGNASVTSTWNVDASGNYSVPGNWTNGVPNSVGATAVFGPVITAPRTVTLDISPTVGEVDFNNTNAYTIAPGGANVLTLNNGVGTNAAIQDFAGSHTISAPIVMTLGTNVNVATAGTTLTLSGAVSNTGAAGTGTITKTGAGTLALTGLNTYADGTTISNGTIQINSANSLGALAGTANLNSTGTGTTATLEALNSITSGRNFTLAGTANTVLVDPGATYEMDGLIADGASAGSLTKTGTGTLALGNNDTYTGGTTVSAGTLQLGAGGTSGSVAGAITDNAALTLNRTDDYALGNVISGTGTLTQAGHDNVTLTGANTFTGNTAVGAGTLTLGNALALQNSTLNYNNQGGTLSFGTLTAATLAGLTGAQNLALTNTTPAAVTLTLGNNSVSSTYTGTLSGAGGVTKNGTGTTTLGSGAAGGATYTGLTEVNQGTLVIGGVTNSTGTFDVSAISGTSGLTFADSAVVNSAGAFNVSSNQGGAAANFPGNSTILVRDNANVTFGSFSFGNGSRVPAGTSLTIQNNAAMTVTGGFNLEATIGSTVSNNQVNLNGGSLNVNKFTFNGGNGTNQLATIHLNGGQLNALAGDTSATVPFLPATGTTVNVDSGGAKINDNGFAITIAAPMVHGTGTPDGGLTKTGAGTLTLDAATANTYTGGTTVGAGLLVLNSAAANGTLGTGGVTVNGTANSSAASATEGVLQLAASSQINDGAPVTLNGGTLNTQGFSEGAAGAPGLGTLALTSPSGTFSFLDYGTGGATNGVSSTLAFANSTGTLGAGQLEVLNYEYGQAATGLASATDHLYLGVDNTTTPLSASQLAQITFVNPTGLTGLYTAAQLASGEIVPGAIAPTPEPGGLVPIIVGLAGTGVLAARRRRARNAEAQDGDESATAV